MSSTAAIPPTQRRAAAFTLSRLLSAEGNPHQTAVARIVLPALQKPFLQITQQEDDADARQAFSPATTLDILQTFLANTDPSPTLVSSVITPIVPALYTLSYSLHRVKSADPALAATLRGLLGTWGRLIGDAEGGAALWLIVDGEGGEWRVDVAGNVRRVERSVCSTVIRTLLLNSRVLRSGSVKKPKARCRFLPRKTSGGQKSPASSTWTPTSSTSGLIPPTLLPSSNRSTAPSSPQTCS